MSDLSRINANFDLFMGEKKSNNFLSPYTDPLLRIFSITTKKESFTDPYRNISLLKSGGDLRRISVLMMQKQDTTSRNTKFG